MSEPASAAPAPPSSTPSWGPPEAWMVLLLSEFVLMFGGAALLGGAKDPSVASQFVALTPFWVVTVVAAARVTGRGGHDPAVELRLFFRPVDLVIGVVAGVGMQLLVIPLLYWPIFEWFDLDDHDLERTAQKLGDASHGAFGTVLLVVMTCVAAPLVEEILYRGLLMGSMTRPSAPGRWGATPWQRVVGLVVSAAVFAALHFNVLEFPGLFLFGLVLGGLVLRTGRLGTSIVTHLAFNAATVVALLASR